MALELGLHSNSRQWRISANAIEERNRIFWTAFAIETTLAYNLGRPPSISEDFVSADLPLLTGETALALRHIEHRRIQSSIVGSVYCLTPRTRSLPPQERMQIIAQIQERLDEWMSSLHEAWPSLSDSAYPLR